MHSRSSEQAPGYDHADPLAAVISLLRPQSVLSKLVSGAGPWSVRYPAHEEPGFCVMIEGSCFIDVDGVGPAQLDQGDFVLLPATPGFRLASDLSLASTAVGPTRRAELRHGVQTGKPSMRMLAGWFRFEPTNAQLVANFLPAIVHVRRDEPGATRLHRIVELITEETAGRRPGRELILERLVEVVLVEALRFRPAEAARQEKGLLAGLADPGLSRALRRIHDDVAHRWTVADLARTAGMSRATFAERFTRLVGMAPMEYVLEWRIAIAKDVLRRERVSLAEVAGMIGYQSASAFSTAFARHAGCPPSEFARDAR